MVVHHQTLIDLNHNLCEVYSELRHARTVTGGVSLGSRRSSSVKRGSYLCTIPLVRSSKLTTRDRGGVGKNLSEGWCVNYSVGCTHGCPFCYVDSIHKRFGKHRYGNIVMGKWGDYLLIPSNLNEAIENTPWKRWQGSEVMMSSTHDPYLPELRRYARRILELALPEGVRFCIQTRSNHILDDLELIAENREQVRLQVSIASSSERLSKALEPRVPSVAKRFGILRKATDRGIEVGVIIAPVVPPVPMRQDIQDDMRTLASSLSEISPKYVFGESLHLRGGNIKLVEDALGTELTIPPDFDAWVGAVFIEAMEGEGMKPVWWSTSHQETKMRSSGKGIVGGPESNRRNSHLEECSWRRGLNPIESGLRNTSEF